MIWPGVIAALTIQCVFSAGSLPAADEAAINDKAAGDVQSLEEQAMQAAVTAIAPSVVRIETVGGLERVGNLLVGTGPTTGLIVGGDGYVISSAFNFVQKPTSILVVLPDGTRVPAEQVATDHSRMLVLLKIKTTAPLLVVPTAVPAEEVSVGQWAIALGHTFDGNKPNMSVGIISALARMWGKAIQTDAKVSPGNYGGPLVDIQGRVLGVLVPLSPQGNDEMAGVEWYDSGIGFAIPLDHVFVMLPRLKKGEDLRPGLLGMSMKRGDLYADAAVLGTVRGKSPASLADLRAGDTIVELDGHSIESQAQMKQQLAPHYAGDKIHVVATRGSERIEKDVELVAKMPAYQHPFLGILPLRDTPEEPVGVTVRFVYPNSPAAKAGLQIGDRITTLDGKAVKSRDALLDQIADWSPDQRAELEVQRGDKTVKANVVLGTLPDAPPASPMPAGHGATKPAEEDPATKKSDVGVIKIKIPEAPNECIAYVPESYDRSVAHGVVIWLHPPGGYKEQELVDRWKAECAAHDLILLAPKSADPTKWQRTELPFILKCLMNLASQYKVDRTRIVVDGEEGGASMAYLLALRHREIVRGVVALDAALPRGTELPENEPDLRLSFFMLNGPHSTVEKQMQSDAERLRKLNFPVTLKGKEEAIKRLATEELSEIVRWIDSLDRI